MWFSSSIDILCWIKWQIALSNCPILVPDTPCLLNHHYWVCILKSNPGFAKNRTLIWLPGRWTVKSIRPTQRLAFNPQQILRLCWNSLGNQIRHHWKILSSDGMWTQVWREHILLNPWSYSVVSSEHFFVPLLSVSVSESPSPLSLLWLGFQLWMLPLTTSVILQQPTYPCLPPLMCDLMYCLTVFSPFKINCSFISP